MFSLRLSTVLITSKCIFNVIHCTFIFLSLSHFYYSILSILLCHKRYRLNVSSLTRLLSFNNYELVFIIRWKKITLIKYEQINNWNEWKNEVKKKLMVYVRFITWPINSILVYVFIVFHFNWSTRIINSSTGYSRCVGDLSLSIIFFNIYKHMKIEKERKKYIEDEDEPKAIHKFWHMS